MYILNQETNKLESLSETTYVEQNIKEREHIEEWIRKNPDVLEEKLIIIAHEYDQFEVSERLDLLAVDPDGNLVIIEVKRDSTGGHADVQALKYASYCSTLTSEDVIEIYSNYIARNGLEVDAVEELMLFLNVEDESDLHNSLNLSQRIIIVANEIDKRILSVASWLHDNGINIKCLTLKPYLFDGKLLIDTNQIIPPYKLKDYYLNKKQPKRTLVQAPTEVTGFLNKVAGRINAETEYKVSYNGKKNYIVGRKFLDIPWRFIFLYKSKESYAEIFLESDKDQAKQHLQEIHENHLEEFMENLGGSVRLVNGTRNTNLYKLIASLEFESEASEDECVEQFMNVFNAYKDYIQGYLR